jgi:hypothetical protein
MENIEIEGGFLGADGRILIFTKPIDKKVLFELRKILNSMPQIDRRLRNNLLTEKPFTFYAKK